LEAARTAQPILSAVLSPHATAERRRARWFFTHGIVSWATWETCPCNIKCNAETGTMAKKKTAPAPVQQKENQTNGTNPKNKMDAVRMALHDRGKDAKPLELQAHIKGTYGIEMTTEHISTYKGVILKKSKGRKKASASKRPTVAKTPGSESHQLNGTTPRAPSKTVSLADQVARLKEVAAAIGKDEAKKIIDLL
jgi:hypothetical protein